MDLLSLPDDIIPEILNFIDIIEYVKLTLVNKTFLNIVKNNHTTEKKKVKINNLIDLNHFNKGNWNNILVILSIKDQKTFNNFVKYDLGNQVITLNLENCDFKYQKHHDYIEECIKSKQLKTMELFNVTSIITFSIFSELKSLSICYIDNIGNADLDYFRKIENLNLNSLSNVTNYSSLTNVKRLSIHQPYINQLESLAYLEYLIYLNISTNVESFGNELYHIKHIHTLDLSSCYHINDFSVLLEDRQNVHILLPIHIDPKTGLLDPFIEQN
jgi:hypothetical protein